MWVEVKALDAPASQSLLGFAQTELKTRLAKLEGKYAIDAWVTSDFDHGAAKRAIQILRRQLTAGLDPNRRLYIGVPSGTMGKGDVSIEWTDGHGNPVRLVSARSTGDSYCCPPGAEPSSWVDEISVQVEGAVKSYPAFKVLSSTDRGKLSLRVIPNPQHVGLASVGNAQASNVTTVEKMRRRIADAGGQVRNGQRYLEIPSLVVIYNDSLGGDQRDLLIACLGDYTVPIDNSTLELGQGFYGDNGVFRPGKNTAVSAVMSRSRLFGTVTMVNPYAAFEIDPSWLPGKVYAAGEDGNLVLVRGA